jgi:hypothetical protein
MIHQTQLARALTVLAEALVAERRVIVVGDSLLNLQELATELGARMVHVYDPKLETPAKGARIFPLPEGDFDVRDGAFDLALVPDLANVPDAAGLLARLRRVVGDDGAVMCAAGNKDSDEGNGLDYYELFDLVSLQFESVRMIAAMPFTGVTLAELGQDEVESAVRVDTQLAGDRPPPSAFVALASQSDVALDAYAVIELESAPATHAAPDVARATEIEAELAQSRLRASYLEAQVDELTQAKAARSRAEEESRRALEALDDERGRASRLEREIDALRQASTQAPPPPPSRDITDLAEQLAETQIRASALEEGVDLAEKTIVAQRDRIAELESALSQAEEEKAVAPPVDAGSAEEEIATLEAKLEERGRRVAELEAEVSRREKLVKELVARLESGPAIIDDDLQRKLDELALLAARQQSELEARAWKIEELSRAAPHS